jgi:hypothetical protein
MERMLPDQGYVSTVVAAIDRHPVVAVRLDVSELNDSLGDWREFDPKVTASALADGSPFYLEASIGTRRSVFEVDSGTD